LFYLSILALSLGTAGTLAAAGFWPVLPFAGLELFALGVALRLSLRRGQMREFICIDERDVVIRSSDGKHHAEYRFARPWTRVRLCMPDAPAWPSRLLMGSMGRAVEVGKFLTESERRHLKTRLAELIPALKRES
jgi:uncharacterized membrane protein